MHTPTKDPTACLCCRISLVVAMQRRSQAHRTTFSPELLPISAIVTPATIVQAASAASDSCFAARLWIYSVSGTQCIVDTTNLAGIFCMRGDTATDPAWTRDTKRAALARTRLVTSRPIPIMTGPAPVEARRRDLANCDKNGPR